MPFRTFGEAAELGGQTWKSGQALRGSMQGPNGCGSKLDGRGKPQVLLPLFPLTKATHFGLPFFFFQPRPFQMAQMASPFLPGSPRNVFCRPCSFGLVARLPLGQSSGGKKMKNLEGSHSRASICEGLVS